MSKQKATKGGANAYVKISRHTLLEPTPNICHALGPKTSLGPQRARALSGARRRFSSWA